MIRIIFLNDRLSIISPLVIAQMAKNTPIINIWEVNSSVDLMLAHKLNFRLDCEEKISNLTGCFEADGSFFIVHMTGIWHVKKSLNHLIKFF